jgi:hypothetical protein
MTLARLIIVNVVIIGALVFLFVCGLLPARLLPVGILFLGAADIFLSRKIMMRERIGGKSTTSRRLIFVSVVYVPATIVATVLWGLHPDLRLGAGVGVLWLIVAYVVFLGWKTRTS